jgi:hypothetical protein
MQDFSIEMTAERIVDRRTREYFREVYSSYVNENYRSATVMLWSVVVADLVFKLEELQMAYEDPAAVEILDAVTRSQLANPTSPAWELDLLEEVKKRTLLLDVAEYQALAALQKQRHLSAHPILTGVRELFAPSREATRANIRAALEAVLTKPALMSRKILDSLLEDLERLRDQELERSELDKFIRGKYLAHMLPKVEDSVFRSLWNLTFLKTDQRCEDNRKVNRQALQTLFERRPDRCLELIEAEPRHYGDVSSEGTCALQLVGFLSTAPRVFRSLPEPAKVIVRAAAAPDADPSVQAAAWFLAPSLKDHIRALAEAVESKGLRLSAVAVRRLRGLAEADGAAAVAEVDRLAILLYGASHNYDTADQRFTALIEPRLERFSRDDMQLLLSSIDQNDQVWGRGLAQSEHRQVKAAAEKVLGKKFDFAKYANFDFSVSRK